MNGRLPADAGRSLCIRILVAALLSLPIAAPALAADGCSLMVPGPLLRAKAYPGQTLDERSKHTSMESASPRPGLRVDIRQDACEDFVTTRFTLSVARGRERERSDDEWIAFARAELARLKIAEPNRLEDLDAFLARAHRIEARKGERSLCRDGSAADAGACSWDSLGGYILSIKRGRGATAIVVTEYISA